MGGAPRPRSLKETVLAEQVGGRAEGQHGLMEMLDLLPCSLQGGGVTFGLEGHLFQNLIREVVQPEHVVVRVIVAPWREKGHMEKHRETIPDKEVTSSCTFWPSAPHMEQRNCSDELYWDS